MAFESKGLEQLFRLAGVCRIVGRAQSSVVA